MPTNNTLMHYLLVLWIHIHV